MNNEKQKIAAIQFVFDLKILRKAEAIATGNILTDEQLTEKYFGYEPVSFPLDPNDQDSIEFAFIFMTAVNALKTPAGKSSFQQMLEEMQAKREGKDNG